jgi:ABC-type polysaccharide transport system, permease component
MSTAKALTASQPVPVKRPKPEGGQLWKRIKRDRLLLLIFLPCLLNIIIFKYIPMFGIVIAFKDYNIIRGFVDSAWVGFAQFERLFSSSIFWRVFVNSFLLNIETLVCSFPISIIFALVLNEARGRNFKKITQTVSYLPYFISIVVVAGMVRMFLSPTTGFISQTIGGILGTKAPYLLGIPGAAHPIYIITNIWKGFGWGTIVYLAVLSGIDTQLYDAADIDGASRLQRIIHITLPALRPTIAVLLIMDAGSLMSSAFDLAYLLQTDLNMAKLETIATYVYKQGILAVTGKPQFSYTTAVGLFQSVLNLVLIVIANKVSNKVSEISLW